MNNTLSPLAQNLAIIAHEAGQLILKHYAAGAEARIKEDASPVTAADEEAEALILRRLAQVAPGIPVVAEEEVAAGRMPSIGEKFFLVDPLDGTKEFIKRNGEFTVNIALIYKSAPVLGVVSVPVSGETYFAAAGLGAWIKKGTSELPLPKHRPVDLSASGLRVVASRSHMNEETQGFIDKLKEPSMVSKGSSLKFMLLAEGKADVYPRYAPTMEWDTAAAHAVVNEVGAKVLQFGTKEELEYNKPDLLNP